MNSLPFLYRMNQTELRSCETWFCHLQQRQNLTLCYGYSSKGKTLELQTNLVRRNLASGLTVGAANGGVLDFLLLASSVRGSCFFAKTETAIS